MRDNRRMYDAQGFLDYFEKVRARTLRVARCIPEDVFESSPIGHGFTFGDLLRHMAGLERYMFAENVAGRASSYSGHGRDLADGAPATFDYIGRLHHEAMAIFSGLGDAGMRASCVTPGGASMPAWKWLRSMVEHEAHHRGQIYVYLSILGIPAPPLYGLTSEEVIERSGGAA